MGEKAVEEKFFCSLVLTSGKEIDLNFQEYDDEIWNELMSYWRMGKIWHCGNWLKLIVIYEGTYLDYVDMKHVVGLRA